VKSKGSFLTSRFEIRYNGAMPKEPFLTFLEEGMKKYKLPLMPVIWGITFLIIGVLVLIGLQGYSSAEREMARQFNSQQLILAQQAARGIESALEETRQNAALLAILPEIVNWAEGNPGGEREPPLKKYYEGFAGKIQLLFLISGDGHRVLPYPPEAWKKAGEREETGLFPPGANLLPAREAVRFVFSQSGGGGGSAGEVSALVTVPISRGGEFVGTLGCLLDFTRIGERFLGTLRPGKTGGAWMISQEGRFVAHYETELVGRNAFSARRDRNPGFSYERIDRIMREEMLRGNTGMDEYVTLWHREKEGAIQKLIAYTPVRAGGQIGSVAVVVPYADVTEVVWGSFKSSLWLLAIMAGTLLAGTYVGQKINRQRVLAEEKVQWSEAIVKSQTRLQALFDGAPDAIILVDPDYRVSTMNKTGLDWYGRPLEDFVGKSCHRVFQGLPHLCPNCPAEESFATGKPAFRERANLVVGKTKRYLQLFTYPLHDRNGKVVEVVEYVKDVTAEKKLQQQVIQSERLAVVGRMSANVAHEIKNPLGTIVLNAELLQEELDGFGGQDTAEAKNLLGVIKSELDRLIEVVEEYLQFARLPKVNLEEGGVNEVVSDLLAFLKEDVAGRGIMLQEELKDSLPRAHLDPRQLRQALLNLVKNSIEAMPDGGKLTIATGAKDGWVEIRISDTGRGIPEENWDLVFTPFFSTKHGGTGLGLPITSHIVEEHHGTISLESFPDLGTIFTIRLPALPAKA
jgi:PAS domain S-box-containing protein